MKDWLEEIIDQVALGQFLATSTITCGQRFGFIAVDNSIEFMLIAFIEFHKQLVGGHKSGGITKRDWDETKKYFPKLLSFVGSKESRLQALEVEINRCHDLRSNLYHSGIPLTITPKRVTKYVMIAMQVLDILFSIRISATEWDAILGNVSSTLAGNKRDKSLKFEVTFDPVNDLVKFTTSTSPTGMEAIALCLYGFSVVKATPPSKVMLIQALAKSGVPMEQNTINTRIGDLRKKGWIQKDALILKMKGKKVLSKKYLF